MFLFSPNVFVRALVDCVAGDLGGWGFIRLCGYCMVLSPVSTVESYASQVVCSKPPQGSSFTDHQKNELSHDSDTDATTPHRKMSTETEAPTKLAVPLKDTKTANVTCFNDRAEVTRELSVEVASAGAYELCVEGLTSRCDPDSIRVKAAEGCKVTINEVAFEIHQKVIADATPGSAGPGGVDTKRAELKALSQTAAMMGQELGRARDHRKLIDGYVKGMLLPVAGGKDGAAAAPAASTISSVQELLAFHAAQCATSDGEVLRLEEELKTAEAAVAVARAALAKLENPAKPRTHASRDVSVLVQVREAAA